MIWGDFMSYKKDKIKVVSEEDVDLNHIKRKKYINRSVIILLVSFYLTNTSYHVYNSFNNLKLLKKQVEEMYEDDGNIYYDKHINANFYYSLEEDYALDGSIAVKKKGIDELFVGEKILFIPKEENYKSKYLEIVYIEKYDTLHPLIKLPIGYGVIDINNKLYVIKEEETPSDIIVINESVNDEYSMISSNLTLKKSFNDNRRNNNGNF